MYSRLIFIFAVVLMMSSASCSKQLVDDNTFQYSERGISRYLSEITEYVYPISSFKKEVSTILFSKPDYDETNRIVFAYINLGEENAYKSYSYGDSEIVVSVSKADGSYENCTYHLNNNIIQDGIINTESDSHYYEYWYNDESQLVKILTTHGNKQTQVDITWEDGNIINIKETSNTNHVTEEKYEYQHNDKYKPSFSMFHLATLNLGVNTGIDQILSSEGYFGNTVSKDLPIKEFHMGSLSREFKYHIDKSGYISKIEQIGKKRIDREYNFYWK